MPLLPPFRAGLIVRYAIHRFLPSAPPGGTNCSENLVPPLGCKGKGKGGVGHQANDYILNAHIYPRQATPAQAKPKWAKVCSRVHTRRQDRLQHNVRLRGGCRWDTREPYKKAPRGHRVAAMRAEPGVAVCFRCHIRIQAVDKGHLAASTFGRWVGCYSSGAFWTLGSTEDLPVAGSVPLDREFGGAAATRHDGDGSVSRTAGVHELAALLLLARLLDRVGLLYGAGPLDVSLCLGLGDVLPGHAERERAGYQYQKPQSEKDRFRNRTSVPYRTAPLTLTDARILHEPATTGSPPRRPPRLGRVQTAIYRS